MKGVRQSARVLIGASLLWAVAACEAAEENEAPRAHVVEMSNFGFQPADLQVAVGDTVIWINRDVVPHTATSEGRWDSGSIASGASWKLVVRSAGVISYLCTFHPTMTGTIRT